MSCSVFNVKVFVAANFNLNISRSTKKQRENDWNGLLKPQERVVSYERDYFKRKRERDEGERAIQTALARG